MPIDINICCQKQRKWQKSALLYGLALSAVVLSATTYMVKDLAAVNGDISDHTFSEFVSDYRFLLEARVRKAKRSYDESSRSRDVERRTKVEKSAKPPKDGKHAKAIKPVKEVPREDLKTVWLMAYPFTGSSVALKILQDFTGYSMGTNYGDVVDTDRGFESEMWPSEPINADSPNGPFKYRLDKPVPPSGYVLVKTHCSGHCIDVGDDSCTLKDYAIALNEVKEFFMSCASGTKYTKYQGGHNDLVEYNPWNTEKLMILSRHPIEVVVSRFINTNEGAVDKYTFNHKGIHEWCKDYDGQKRAGFLENWYLPEAKALADSGKVPCHAELYRIARFYNQAFKTVYYLDEEVHVVHFEDYETDLGATIQGMMDFLEYRVKESQRSRPFERTGEDGYSYFSADDIKNMLEFFRIIASDKTQELFASYV